VLSCLVFAAFFVAGMADATQLALNPALNFVGEGLDFDAQGIGLQYTRAGNITVEICGPVEAAFLYWAGRDMPCATNGGGTCLLTGEDADLEFDGNPITGTVIGSEFQIAFNGPWNNIGYRADVTSIVEASGTGAQTFFVEDVDATSNLDRLNGATLLVVCRNEADDTVYQISVYEGLDFAYDESTPDPAKVTNPVDIAIVPVDEDRSAELLIVVGDAESSRPDRIDISDNPSITDSLNGSAGPSWDNDVNLIFVPANETTTTVEVVSPPERTNADSLLWELAAVRAPFPLLALGCRVTGGGHDTSGNTVDGSWDGTMAKGKSRGMRGNGFNVYSFGGQAGANTGQQPQPKGEWTHHQKRGPAGSFVFHAGTASAPPGTEIDVIICSDEENCDPARTAPSKQIDFAGVGTFKNLNAGRQASAPIASASVMAGETFHWFEVHIEDLGEPGNEPKGVEKKNMTCAGNGSGTDAFADPPVFLPADCGCADFYRIRIFEGVIPVFDQVTGEITNMNKTDIIYEVYGYIDGGNLQIHPPTGFDMK
jgi:hypothetical protein